MCHRRRSSIGRQRWARNLEIGDARFALRRSRRSRLGLRARCFLGAHRFDSNGFDPGRFSSDRLLLGREGRRRFSGRGNSRFFFFSRCLDVGRLATTTNRLASDGRRLRSRDRFGRRRPTASRHRRGRRLLLSAITFFALPASADASHLVVGEHTHMAANGYVHLPKKCDHFIGRHREFAGQLTD